MSKRLTLREHLWTKDWVEVGVWRTILQNKPDLVTHKIAEVTAGD